MAATHIYPEAFASLIGSPPKKAQRFQNPPGSALVLIGALFVQLSHHLSRGDPRFTFNVNNDLVAPATIDPQLGGKILGFPFLHHL